MAIYTVHVPSAGDAVERAERTQFVRDGFSWAALAFGPLYLFTARATVAALAWIVVVAALAALCWAVGMPGWVETGLALLIVLFTGLEAATLRRLALHRRGFDLVDVVEGAGRDGCERAFFRKATLEGLPPRRTVGGPSRLPHGPVIGYGSDGWGSPA